MTDAAKAKPKSGGDNPVAAAATLDEETQKQLLSNTPISASASGQHVRDHAEGAPEPIKGDDRGSTQEIAGDVKPDFITPSGKPQGLQAEPALMTPTGSIRSTMVGSPSGPVPVSTRAADPEAAAKILNERNESIAETVKMRELRNLSDDELSRLSAAEIRAVATDRGYNVPNRGGRRAAARDFATAQGEDERVKKVKAPKSDKQ